MWRVVLVQSYIQDPVLRIHIMSHWPGPAGAGCSSYAPQVTVEAHACYVGLRIES